MLSQPELWTRIEQFDLDGRDSALFTHRLRRKLKLSTVQTELAISEYRRYLYLAECSVVQTHPSPILLNILKIHLGLPGHAWDRFLAEIAGDATHYKNLTSSEANPLARVAYLQTRTLYRKEFGEEAQPKFWPNLPQVAPPVPALALRRRLYEALAVLCLVLALIVSGLALFGGAYVTVLNIGVPILLISLHFMFRAGKLHSHIFRLFHPKSREIF